MIKQWGPGQGYVNFGVMGKERQHMVRFRGIIILSSTWQSLQDLDLKHGCQEQREACMKGSADDLSIIRL